MFLLFFFININNIKYINVVIRVKRILKYYQEQWDFNIDSISSGFNLNVDQYLITFYLGKDALTVYQTASKIYSSFISLASAVGAVIIPRAMILNGVSNKFRAIMLPFVIFSMVFSIAHFILAPSISNLLFNLPIKLNESVFIILSIVIFVRYLSAAAGSSLMIIGLQKIRATINILVNIITVIVAVLLGFFIQYDINKIILLVLFSQILMLLIYIAFIMKVRNESIHK
ncbi:hypothetical protein AYY22_16060 [Photobacterium kishitanii]|nr:hypothetical protein AYY22_16060 [Photobacterium kishitanii]